MRTAKINVTKIDKTALFAGQNGKYLDVVFFENKNGLDQYGNNGFVTQDIGKERRLAGERGPIIGNWKWDDAPKEQAPPPAGRYENAEAVHAAAREGDDDIPF
jgi:hypothetical protein